MAGSPTARPFALSPLRGCRRRLGVAALFALALFGAGSLDLRPAAGQSLNTDWVGVPKGPPPSNPGKADPNPQMLVQADEVQYDYANQRVIAVGNVQIYYAGSSLEANRVVYDQKNKRLRAEGNVRLTEADGRIVYGEIIDLTDDYRDGFVDSLRLEGPDRTRFAAPRAERSEGKSTIFENGVYTACEPCKEDPTKPPKWQVKAARIIHDQTEKMIYFEGARLEALGIPLVYWPFFSAPDPTVKRKTGWLIPMASYSSNYGAGVIAPYYWALAPNYDLTLTPMLTSKQGLLMQGEWRQRFETGAFSVRAAGIRQLDPGYFVHTDGTPTPGNRDWRGEIDSRGQFALSDKWVWGWDAILLSDKTFLQDYNLRTYYQDFNTFRNGTTEGGTSQLYLIGRGDRSYFDIRTLYYYGLSEMDSQKQLPIIHPVIDYTYTFGPPMLGGELSWRANLTSLSRQEADFDPITQNAILNDMCGAATANPNIKTPANCLLRGIPGTYSRFSAETMWRRTMIDPIGQMFTPFVKLRADVAYASITNQVGVGNFIAPGDQTVGRVMPTVGLEYRYPFIGVHSWGTQTIEPIGQLIIRPNEQNIGRLPNEDAQSLIFDTDNLFRVDKFSGWDRAEGGSRANVGVQYTAQFNRAGNINVMFGQSYSLFGQNSFAVGDTTNTGLNSGLETTRSDYVGRFTYQPDRIFSFTTRFRFDEQTFAVRRAEAEARASFDRWSVSLLYGNYDAQPDIGFLTRRDGLLGQASVKLTPNWSVLGALRYDINGNQLDQLRVGLGYIDDCFAIATHYITEYQYSGNATGVNHTVMLQLSLRTLGGTAFSQRVGSSGGL